MRMCGICLYIRACAVYAFIYKRMCHIRRYIQAFVPNTTLYTGVCYVYAFIFGRMYHVRIYVHVCMCRIPLHMRICCICIYGYVCSISVFRCGYVPYAPFLYICIDAACVFLRIAAYATSVFIFVYYSSVESLYIGSTDQLRITPV